MATSAFEPGKKYLSQTLAEWACSLSYESLSSEAVQKAKLFWFDSLGCALGGSRQDDAKILMAHYREMGSSPLRGGSEGGSGPCTCFVSGFKTNPVDAAFRPDQEIASNGDLTRPSGLHQMLPRTRTPARAEATC